MQSVLSFSRRSVYLSVVALTLGLTSCGGDDESVSITGAGASFPAPLYQRWFRDMSAQNPNLLVDYQSVGSGSGVKQFTEEIIDFGASDVAMKDAEISKIDRGVLMLPMTAGCIVLAYNLPDVPELKLSRSAYVDIFLGKITKWNDPRITGTNPGLDLPNQKITVIHRSDGSGTTGVFTKHLSAINPEWKNKVGEGKTVEWPTGIGGKGNEGVSAQIKQNAGAIGYVEYGFAKSSQLNVASLENKAGKFIKPTDESASLALGAVKLPENLRAFITDPEGAESYPIVTYTWLLAYKKYDDPKVAKAVEEVIEYGLTEGQKVSQDLGYIKLPQNVREKVAQAANQISPDYEIDVSK